MKPFPNPYLQAFVLYLGQPDKSFKYAKACGSFKVRKLHRALSIGLQNWLLKFLGQPDE